MNTMLCWMSLRPPLCSTSSASVCCGSSLIRKGTTARARQSIVAKKIEGFSAKERPLDCVARRLILLRHAESSWDNQLLRDHDRCLSNTGRADAAHVAYKLQQLGWIPEVILCSDATRTKETLSVMQEHVKGFLEAAVHFCPSFYSVAAMDGQTAEHLQQMICRFSGEEILTVLCMGHNKGWEEAASMLTGSAIELKTCNAALLEARGESWEQAFALAGIGGWKLHAIIKPYDSLDSIVPS